MSRANLNDLQAFVVITREGSFTRAAAQLGVSQSALSHTMRALETRLGPTIRTSRSKSQSTTPCPILSRSVTTQGCVWAIKWPRT